MRDLPVLAAFDRLLARRAAAPRLRLRLILALVPAVVLPHALAAPAIFPYLLLPKPPDRSQTNTDQVRKIASAISRACPRQAGFAWNSANPLNDLQQLSAATMGNLREFENVSERASFPGRAVNGQRLYLARLSQGPVAFTFLWSVARNEVSLQICGGDRPAALEAAEQPDDGEDIFTNCSKSGGGILGPLSDPHCPKAEKSM